MATPSTSLFTHGNYGAIPLVAAPNSVPIAGLDQCLRSQKWTFEDPSAPRIYPGSLIIVPNCTQMSTSGEVSQSLLTAESPQTRTPSACEANSGNPHICIVQSIKETPGSDEHTIVAYVVTTLGWGERYPPEHALTTLDDVEVPSQATWIPVSIPSPHPLPQPSLWRYDMPPPFSGFTNSTPSWVQVRPITFQIHPETKVCFSTYLTHDIKLIFTQYRTIICKSANRPIFATPFELQALSEYAGRLKARARRLGGRNGGSEEGGPTGARQKWAQGPPKYSRRGGAGRTRSGANYCCYVPGGNKVTTRPFQCSGAGKGNDLNVDSGDDSDNDSDGYHDTPGDWATEVAQLAAQFGGIFTSMHEDAQRLKKKEREDMVRRWQQGIC